MKKRIIFISLCLLLAIQTNGFCSLIFDARKVSSSLSFTSPLVNTSGTVTINNAAADGSTKGAAAFNSTNFSASSGVINTIQNIATSSSPAFAGLTVTSTGTGNFTNIASFLAPSLTTGGNKTCFNVGVANALNNLNSFCFDYQSSGSTGNSFDVFFAFHTYPSAVFKADNTVGLGGTITSTSTLAGAQLIVGTSSVKIPSLTSGQIPYIGTGGLVQGSNQLTYEDGYGITVDSGGGFPGYQINFETSQMAKIYWDNDLGFTHFDSAAQVAFNNSIFQGDTSLTSGYGRWTASNFELYNNSTFTMGDNGAGAKVNIFAEGGDGTKIISIGDSNFAQLFTIAGSTSSAFLIQMGDVDVQNGDSVYIQDNNSFTFNNGVIIPNSGIRGTLTNDDATSLNVGQFSSSFIAVGSATSLTTATAKNVTSISLTAGDWDVSGNVNFVATTATVTAWSGGISTNTNALPTDGSEVPNGTVITLISENNGITLPRKRISIASTTTVYLVGKATFSAGTVTAYGGITARRVR